jgi:hypothetical protein
MFTYFTDRDGKFQLKSFAESAFDPLARTTRFMLTEEAHHMFVGETGVGRVIKRTLEVMKELDTDDVATLRKAGVIDLPTIQKFMNFWFTSRWTCSARKRRRTPPTTSATASRAGRTKPSSPTTSSWKPR